MLRYEGVADDNYWPILFARTLLPLVQVPPAGFWRDRTRPRFVVDARPLPDPATPRRSCWSATWAPSGRRACATPPPGRASRSATSRAARERAARPSPTRDERGAELLDLPGAPLPPARTRLPVRLLARWDQALLAYADRARIIPPEVEPLKLTHSGDQTITVDGRVAASWWLRRARESVQVEVRPHVDIRRSAHAPIRAEAKRTARFAEPDARRIEVVGL